MPELSAESELQFAGPVRPINEVARLAALTSHQILDTPAEAVFDQITKAAADLCGTPLALISLLDESRQWIKSSTGTSITSLPRDMSLCQYTILQAEKILVIENALEDSRVANHQMVAGEPNVRFYAGLSLTTPTGHAIGTLCVLDFIPRQMTQSQKDGLRQLGDVTKALLEQRLSDKIAPLLNRVIENKLNLGIVIFDSGGSDNSIIYCNPSFESLSGYSHEEIIGKDISLIHAKDGSATEIDRLHDAFNSNKEQSLTLKSYRKDGTEFWNEVTLSPIYDAHNNLTHYISIHQDVTRRYLAEERNFEFGTVLEESLNEIYICDAKTFKFIQVNKGARRNLGYNMRELSEMTPLDASDDATRKKILDTAPSMIDGSRDKFVYYGVNKRKDGSTYEVEAHVQHMLFNGRPVYLTVVLDITARKKAERLLREAHEELEQRVNERTAELETMTKIAEHANAGKTRFLSAASHDLRQPLQALQLYLSALTARLDHPKSKRLSDKMQLSLNTISGLLDSLLDTSALESGAVKPFKKSVALSEVLNRIVNVSKQQATKKGLEFHCESVSCSIHTDPGLLERVVANFIANAIRYTVQGVIEIRCEQIDDFVRISVVDTGVGISETQLESVFDEYFQVDDPAIKQKKGLGLGLSIAKYIARLLDHPIRVKSIIGQGSTFSIDVPLGTAAVEPARSSVIDSAKFGHFTSRPTVLMVDDDPDVMDAMIELVSTFDVELHTAMNGNEALDQVRGGLRPELLISDFRMPGMNGLELTNAVRKILNCDLPVIIMTGDISTAKIKEANLVNCSAFLKPIKVEELMPLIEAARAHAP